MQMSVSDTLHRGLGGHCRLAEYTPNAHAVPTPLRTAISSVLLQQHNGIKRHMYCQALGEHFT